MVGMRHKALLLSGYTRQMVGMRHKALLLSGYTRQMVGIRNTKHCCCLRILDRWWG